MKNAILYAIAIMQLTALTVNYAAGADTVANLLPAYEKLSNALFQDDLVAAQRTASELANGCSRILQSKIRT